MKYLSNYVEWANFPKLQPKAAYQMLIRKVLSKLNSISLRGKILVAFFVIMALFLYRVSSSTRYHIVEKHGQEDVALRLEGAHNYFYNNVENMAFLFRTTIRDMQFTESFEEDLAKLSGRLQEWPAESRPDFIYFANQDGKVVYSRNNRLPKKEDYPEDIIKRALVHGEVNGLKVLNSNFLKAEQLDLNSSIDIVSTPKSTKPKYNQEEKAMAIVIAEPIQSDSKLVGTIVMGKILNNNNTFVDQIRDNYGVRATIFLDKVRIATNVVDNSGKRAIGTLLSDTVYDQVIKNGERYTGRAFVVNDWYITAYEPVTDINGNTIGALYVGSLEAPLLGVQQAVDNEIRLTLFLALIVFTIAILWIYALVVKPISDISNGVLHIARGAYETRFPAAHPNQCWEIRNCNHKDCRAYGNPLIRCWLLPDTWCRHEGNNYGQMDPCLKCDVYNLFSGTELDRLTDAVNLMATFIEEKTTSLESLNLELECKNKELSDSRDELESQKDDLLNLNARLEASMKALDDSQNIIYALAVAVEAKDPYTRGHSERVAEYSMRLAGELRLDDHELELLKGAALLHDIGKIGISGSILRKPGTLNALEFQQVRKHPSIGERICLSLKFAQEMLPIIRHHHEHFNGQGYPDGLKGEHIPLLARIISVADAYDAMTSDRPYRSGLPVEEAVRRLKEGAGSQWDPRLIPIFVELVRKDLFREVAVSSEKENFLE